MPIRTRLRELSESHLPKLLAVMRDVVTSATPPDSTLIEMSNYVFDTGGKRLRALLPLLVADALGRELAPVVPFGAACELIHNATLIHDDLQDGDEVRRGKPAVWRAFGLPQAIDLGDAFLYYAVLAAQRVDVPLKAREACIRRMMLSTLTVVDGQEREMALRASSKPTLADYVTMVEGKTSGLFSLPIAGAAELCGASPAQVEALDVAASHLGVLFQIQDDLLDLYGEKGRGHLGCDIEEGKRSILAVYALEHSTPQAADELLAILDRDRTETTSSDIDRARELLSSAGAVEFALGELVRRRTRARRLLENTRDQALADLIDGIADVFLVPIQGLFEQAP